MIPLNWTERIHQAGDGRAAIEVDVGLGCFVIRRELNNRIAPTRQIALAAWEARACLRARDICATTSSFRSCGRASPKASLQNSSFCQSVFMFPFARGVLSFDFARE